MCRRQWKVSLAGWGEWTLSGFHGFGKLPVALGFVEGGLELQRAELRCWCRAVEFPEMLERSLEYGEFWRRFSALAVPDLGMTPISQYEFVDRQRLLRLLGGPSGSAIGRQPLCDESAIPLSGLWSAVFAEIEIATVDADAGLARGSMTAENWNADGHECGSRKASVVVRPRKRHRFGPHYRPSAGA